MKFTLKKLPKSVVEITITNIDEELLKKHEKQSLKELASNMKIKGFREGCVPENIVREKIEPEKLRMQIIHNTLPDIWIKAVEENKIFPIGQPELSVESFDPLELKWKVPVRPEIAVGNYKKIKIDKKEVKIGKKEIDEVIDDIKKRNQTGKQVERAAKKGDKVEIDFEGKTLDGVPLDNTKSKNHPVILGESSLVPGFEEKIEGMKIGEEKEIEITFPKDYRAKNMAGKKIMFKIKLNRIEELTLPEIDKELAKKVFGKEMEKEEFMKEIEDVLKKQAEQEEKQRRENNYYDELLKLISCDIPDILINEEKDQIIQEMKQRIMYQGLSFQDYLKHIKKTEEELRESFSKEAENRIKLQLGINEIAKLEKIEIPDEDVEIEISKMLERYDKKEQDTIKKKFEKGTEGFRNLQHRLKMQKAINTILPK